MSVSTRKRVRVLVVIKGTEYAGVRTHLLYDQAYGTEAGIDSEYLCLEAGSLYEALRERGAPVTIIGGKVPGKSPRSRLLLPLLWLRALRGFRAAYSGTLTELRRHRPDIVYVHNPYLRVICGLAAKRASCPSVGCFHNMLNRTPLFGLQRVFASMVYAYCLDAIVALSGFARDTLWGPARRIARTIYNGLEFDPIDEAIRGVSKVPRRLALIGRITVGKKQDVALRALAHLRDQNVHCTLDIIGGPADDSNLYFRHLRKLAEQLDITDRVNFTGWLSPPHPRLAAAEVCLNCSTSEALAYAVPEAMACGTTVVVAAPGPLAELVQHGVTGLHFQADNPESLAAVTKELLVKPELRSRLAAGARAESERTFDIRARTERLRDLFLEVRATRYGRHRHNKPASA